MNFEQNENKYLFGAFLNTAYDNFNEVLSHIDTVIKAIKNEHNPETVDTIFEIQEKCINWLFDTLESWRNYTTHYIHPDVLVSPETILLLDRSFSKGIKIIKQRFALQNEDLDHLCSTGQAAGVNNANGIQFYCPTC